MAPYPKNIEVEVRSFITETEYTALLTKLKKETEFLGEDTQVTYYFDAPVDVRIQQNDTYAKIWLKKGKLHDDYREEIEIKFAREDFAQAEAMFLALGYSVSIKWYRTRNTFKKDDLSIMLDHTKGYGHIIELEKMTTEEDKGAASAHLKDELVGLGITLTPKSVFDERFADYKTNWKTLTA